jgi:hypothetical protein
MNLKFSIGWRAKYNPTDATGGDRCAGVFRRAEDATDAVKGKSWWGADGRIEEVLVLEDEAGKCIVIGRMAFQEFK